MKKLQVSYLFGRHCSCKMTAFDSHERSISISKICPGFLWFEHIALTQVVLASNEHPKFQSNKKS